MCCVVGRLATGDRASEGIARGAGERGGQGFKELNRELMLEFQLWNIEVLKC
jgi:hypothetical protein